MEQTSPKLTIELVPRTTWQLNARSELSQRTWDKIRKREYTRTNNKCEICGVSGRVECHEKWTFNHNTKIQKLVGLFVLCNECHQVKHIGRAYTIGKGIAAEAHLRVVNKWTKEEASEYITKCFEIWEDRSKITWTLDLSYLKEIDAASNLEM